MQIKLLSAISATATSSPQNIENITQVTVVISSPSISSGTGTLSIDGSNDGINWVTSIGAIDIQATNKSTALVNSKATAGTGAQAVGLYLSSDCGFKMVRAVATISGVGAYDVVLQGTKFAVT